MHPQQLEVNTDYVHIKTEKINCYLVTRHHNCINIHKRDKVFNCIQPWSKTEFYSCSYVRTYIRHTYDFL